MWIHVVLPFIENKRLSIWQHCRHLWHRKLSLWQLTVPPVTTKLSIWRPFFSLFLPWGWVIGSNGLKCHLKARLTPMCRYVIFATAKVHFPWPRLTPNVNVLWHVVTNWRGWEEARNKDIRNFCNYTWPCKKLIYREVSNIRRTFVGN